MEYKIGIIKTQTCATIESNPNTAMKAATLSDEKPIICIQTQLEENMHIL